MLDYAPTITPIGSCRVRTPVEFLRRRGLVKTRLHKAPWYTHSTRDALQKIKIVKNELILPEALVPLTIETASTKWHPEAHRPDIMDGTDVFVVEICSRKIISVDGIYFQQWCVQEVLKSESSPKTVVDIVSHAINRVQSREEVYSDLTLLCDRLARPVIFVSHINVKMSNGSLFPEREIIKNILQDFCKNDPRATFFDPTIVVSAAGEERALVDSGHYLQEFNHDIGQAIYEVAGAVLTADMPSAQLVP
jgi:hypothetical protein